MNTEPPPVLPLLRKGEAYRITLVDAIRIIHLFPHIFHPEFNCPGMGVQPFGSTERDRGIGKSAQLLGPAFEDRGALHEIEHAEPGGETCRARGRQHVVRSGDVIADRFRRMRADEDRAGIADFRH